MTEPAILHTDATLAILVSRNVQVNIWSDAPKVEQIPIFSRSGASLSRRHPRGAGLLNVILRGTPSFPEDVRDETVKLMKQAHFRLGSAHLVVVEGFKGIAARAFMSTVMLLARPVVPNKVFSDAASAAAWLVPLLAPGPEVWTRAEIVALVEKSIARVG